MKNKIIKKVALLLTFAFVLLLSACDSQKQEKFITPTEKFFINDFAGIMTEEDVNTIYNSGAALQEATTAQAVVVTVETLDDQPIEDYALEIGREWGIGAENEDNGVVILLSKADREIYIAVGYGLEGALPDSKTGRIIDNYGLSYFSNDNFSTGLTSIYNAVVNEIYIEYGLQPTENYIPADLLPSSQSDEDSVGKVLISWIILLVFVVIYIMIFGRRGGMLIFSSPRFFSGVSNGHHSGFGGSSGGFGGFKGGGGSFGGGGAGRKF